MKKAAIFSLILMFLMATPKAQTLQGLLDKYNAVLAEPDSAEAYLSDSLKKVLVNLAQQKVSLMTGLLQRYTQFAFSRDSGYYDLPGDFSRIKGVLIKSKGQWYTVFDDPMFKLDDTSKMRFSISWENKYDAEINIAFGNLIYDQTDFLYSPDSVAYDLPDDFRQEIGVMVDRGGFWFQAIENPYLAVDTGVPSYFAVPDDSVGGTFYFRAKNMVPNDTIRVFYWRTAKSGDSVRVLYYARADWMDDLTDTTQYPPENEPFVVEEAVKYYYQALRAFNVEQTLFQQSRIDMGVLKEFNNPGEMNNAK